MITTITSKPASYFVSLLKGKHNFVVVKKEEDNFFNEK